MTNPAYRTKIAGSSTPIDVDDLLVLKSNFFPGNGYAWGDNTFGSLGLGTSGNSYSSPTIISSTSYWKQISSAERWSIGIKSDNTICSWGKNQYGQLGLGNLNNYYSPTTFSLPSAIVKEVFTNFKAYHVLATTIGTSHYSWGSNTNGQLGNGTITNYSTPTAISGNIDWLKLSCGENFSAGIDTLGNIYSWGLNSNGQLGLGNNNQYSVPQQISSPGGTWRSISAGRLHILALDNTGYLWGCGFNNDYQLGYSGSGTNSLVQIGTSIWAQVYAADTWSIGIKVDGTLWSWGSDYEILGFLGQNGIFSCSTPTQIGTMSNWKTAVIGENCAAAIKSDGTLWTWGLNSSGQLGLGHTTNLSSPVQVGSLNNWKSVSAGDGFMTAQQYSQ